MLEFTADEPMRKVLALAVLAIAAGAGAFMYYARGSHLSLNDVITFPAAGAVVGALPGDPLARLGLTPADIKSEPAGSAVRFIGKSKYLNGARAVGTHTIDDSTKFIATSL